MDSNVMTEKNLNDTFNADSIKAIKEVELLKQDPSKKTYASFAELLKDD